MRKNILLILLVFTMVISTGAKVALAAPSDFYVSPTGNDLNACTLSAPCKTIQKGVNTVLPGGTLHILAGTYAESVTVSKMGTQTQPIRIVGENAMLRSGGATAFTVTKSQWVSFEGLNIAGYTVSDFEVNRSHYLAFRNNALEFAKAGIRFRDGASHVLIENNEIYQTYPAGSTWTTLKGSAYEGGGVYASTGGQGMYIIRGNNFHDSFNGVYMLDDLAGSWMNANVFIGGNTFKNIVDDPFEPEGDSFNVHFYNNNLINTHRMASIVPNATCVGPIFVYGNYQHNTMDPTGDAATGRKNSAIKMDMSLATCTNGVWVFNNTVNANVTGTNFTGVDMLTTSVKNYKMLNNILVTEKNVYSKTPVFTNSASNYNIGIKPFGDVEPNSLLADPLLSANGTLLATSPAKGRGVAVDVPSYFAAAGVVPGNADLGAFRSFPKPVYVLPPGGEPADFPANIPGWPDAPVSVVPTTTAQATLTSTPIVLPSATTVAPTTAVTPTSVPVTSTTVPSVTSTAVPPTFTSTAAPATATTVPATSTPLPPTFTATAVPATSTAVPATSTPLPPTLTSTVVPATFTATPLPPTFTATAIPATATTVPVVLPSATAVVPPTTVVSLPIIGTVYNDKNPALIYSGNWETVQKSKAYEGSYQYTKRSGSSVSLIFSGQSFSLLYTAGRGFGSMDIYIDNQLVATVKQRAEENKYQKLWDYQGNLPAGQHELKLVYNGSDDAKGSIDAVIVR